MSKRVVITGIGVVNPSGLGKRAFWGNVSEGRSSIAGITRFDCGSFPVKVAGEVSGFKAGDFIPRRFVVKTDRFAHFALAASDMALADASLDLDAASLDPYRVGVWFGNNAGGWDICERGLYELYRDGATLVNPWQATAWFPTSAQGYVTIAKGIKGCSKSFVCDRASGASAMYFAARSIASGQNDVVLAGGTEAPITAFGMTCYFETGEVAPAVDALGAYRPFDRARRGLVLGEGSTVLVLESLEHAKARGARIYGEIVGGAMANDADAASGAGLVRAMGGALARAGKRPADVDLVFAEGAATSVSDRVEAESLGVVFGGKRQVPVTCPKSGYGHLYGASTPTDIACGLLAAESGTVPPTPGFESGDDGVELDVVTQSRSMDVRTFMVNSRAREGSNVSLVVSTSVEAS